MGNSVGKGGKVNRSSAETGLLDIASSLINDSAPLRKEVIGQTTEAMQTGGIGARLPIVQKGIEASRSATSSALAGLGEEAARGGYSRNSFNQALQAQTQLQGNLATEAIPQQAAEQFIAIAPTLTTGLSGQALQGFTSTAGLANQRSGIQAQRDIAKGQQQVEYVKAIGSIAGAAACWLARAAFGDGTPKYEEARRFIFYQWQGPVACWVRRAYLRHGEALSKWRLVVWLVRPMLEVAAWRARRAGFNGALHSGVGERRG